MDTPICDFVRHYSESSALRAHMPGHKGCGLLGMEHLDITEIEGADSLYEADGIIRQSEQNASRLFGCETFYSTEGSSQCIRAMLYLAVLHARQQGKKPVIAAARNVHKTFLSAAALLDFEVKWLYGSQQDSYLSCKLDEADLDVFLCRERPTALYVTSPDYLGHIANIASLARVCHRHGCLLLMDNAHGAYLKFLERSLHPIDLGADMCCDSAHKTLPVLTGGAYLHISTSAPPIFSTQAKNALALFGSTSPSYLILQSLDAANRYLSQDYGKRLSDFILKTESLKKRLTEHGYHLTGDEPIKLTICSKAYGYTGKQMAQLLLSKDIVCEFSDPDFVVMMLTPEIGAEGLHRLEQALLGIPKQPEILDEPPGFHRCEPVLSIRQATLSPSEEIPVSESLGRILASACVGCPPAVPIVVCGERISQTSVACFQYYGIESCNVLISQ